MAGFDYLYERSAQFARIFVGENTFFRSIRECDTDVCSYFWDLRYPKLNWNLCARPKCENLVMEGKEYCTVHDDPKREPHKWAWINGVLYKLVKSLKDPTKSSYVANVERVALLRYREIDDSHSPFPLDGNFLNHAMENIVLLSDILIPAVKDDQLTPQEALNMDKVVSMAKCGTVWTYTDSELKELFRVDSLDELKQKGVALDSLRSVVEEAIRREYAE